MERERTNQRNEGKEVEIKREGLGRKKKRNEIVLKGKKEKV